MENLFLAKGKSIGNANLPGRKVGPYNEDTKLNKKVLEIIQKNIPYLISVGVLIKQLEASSIEAELVNKDDESEDELNDESEDENEDEFDDDNESEDEDDGDWKSKLNETEKKFLGLLEQKSIVNLLPELSAKGIKCKKSTPKDEIIRLIMGK